MNPVTIPRLLGNCDGSNDTSTAVAKKVTVNPPIFVEFPPPSGNQPIQIRKSPPEQLQPRQPSEITLKSFNRTSPVACPPIPNASKAAHVSWCPPLIPFMVPMYGYIQQTPMMYPPQPVMEHAYKNNQLVVLGKRSARPKSNAKPCNCYEWLEWNRRRLQGHYPRGGKPRHSPTCPNRQKNKQMKQG